YLVVGTEFHDTEEGGGGASPNAGAAHVFEFDAGLWSQVQKLTADDRSSNDNYGAAVAISLDRIMVAAAMERHEEDGGGIAVNGAGSAYIYGNYVESELDGVI